MTNAQTGSLHDYWLFAGIESEKSETLLMASRKMTLARNQVLFSRGDKAEFAYLVLEGEIAIEVVSKSGRTVRVVTMSEGDLFGEFALLGSLPRSADARAVSTSSLLRIDGAAFLAVVQDDIKILNRLNKLLIHRLCVTNEQVEKISLFPLKARLAALLSSMATKDSLVAITQTELAERLTASREKVNIILQELQKAGVVSLKRGQINLLDSDLLESLSRL